MHRLMPVITCRHRLRGMTFGMTCKLASFQSLILSVVASRSCSARPQTDRDARESRIARTGTTTKGAGEERHGFPTKNKGFRAFDSSGEEAQLLLYCWNRWSMREVRRVIVWWSRVCE